MPSLFQAAPPRILLYCCALATALLVSLAITGCDEVDPLEAIRQQQATNDFAGSLEPLQKLIATHPDDPEVNFLYGQALAATKGGNVAMWSLRKAMKDPDWLVPAGSLLALSALTAGDYNEVVEITEQILEREPENLKALLMRANAQAHWKRSPELALADADRVLELDPDLVEAYEPRILALLDLGRTDEAGEALAEAGRKVTELGTSEAVLAWHCATMAVFQQEVGDPERARETWTGCLTAHPINQDVVFSATSFYDSMGEWNRSIEVLRTALAKDPASRASRIFRVTLAERLRLSGDSVGAEAVLLEATRFEDPELLAAAWMDLAKHRQAVSEHGAAADALERALELAREAGAPNPALLFDYADALVLAGQLDRALEAADDLSLPAYRQLIHARVAQERRDPARALEGFDEANRLWPDNPYSRYYTATAAEELGDFDRALAEYRYAIRISPDATDARTRGATLLFAEGRPTPALQILRTGGEGGPPADRAGQLLFMRLTCALGDIVAMSDQLVRIENANPAWAGPALAEAAEGLAQRNGPAVALSMLASAPGVDYSRPRYAEAQRTLMRLSHEIGKTDAMRGEFQAILAAHPDVAGFQEIRGFDLELSGAPAESVREAYTRAVDLEPENARALEGLGRLAFRDDPEAALAFFDRAAAADPDDPDPKLQAAKALIASGKPSEAAERLDALLLEHPYEAEAAAERVRLDLEQGIATEQTLERARRAARFGGGADAFELLSRVHIERDDLELGARAAERAQALRAAKAPEEPTASEG